VANKEPSSTRRRFLSAVGATTVAGVAGCSSRAGNSGSGGRTAGTSTPSGGRDSDQSTPIEILAAGSLQHALETGLESAVDVPVEIETHGSAIVARMVAEGQRDPDIVTVADTALFERPLSPPWYSVFASNAVVLAYNPETEGGRRLEEAGNDQWYEPLVDGDVRLGRTDPDQDPLGYRTLFALELASRYYEDASNLREMILRREQIYPETALVSQFETGAVDAAITYRNMAVERDYEYVELPDQIDLSSPNHAEEWYSTVSYTLPSGQKVEGGPISYASTVRKASDAAVSVFEAHTTSEYLAASGFVLRDEFPTYEGDVPDRIRATMGRPRTTHAISDSAPIGDSAIQSPAGTVSDNTTLS
jgi:molybdate/tungstate transport system substrate-binding protein